MIIKIVKATIVYLIILMLFQLIFYQFKFTLENASNAFFYVGIFSFVFGLISITNAQNVFIGFRYYLSQLFRKREIEEKVHYSEYKDDKYNKSYTYKAVVMLIAGIAFIIIALLLSYFSMR